MKKKHIVLIIIISLICLIIFKLAANKNTINESNKKTLTLDVKIPVTVSMAVEEMQEINIIKTGSLTPFKEAKLVSVANGTVQKLFFKLGDRVTQGQVLAIIDTHVLQLDLQKSETQVARLKNDLKTYTELLQGNAATQEKVNEIRQNYNDAVNSSNQFKRQIGDSKIKAPTSGIISTKLIEEGVYLASGGEIASIVNLSQLKIQVNLTESEVYKIKEGQIVKLSTEIYPDKTFAGTITYISPQADQTHNYVVEITASNDKDFPLRAGTFVYADFSRKTSLPVVVIPREALIDGAKNASIYVVNKNKVSVRMVETGSTLKNNIQITKGLSAGEQVVTSGQINLKDGSLVSISK